MKSKKLRFVVFMGILSVNLLKGAEASNNASFEVTVDEQNPTELVLTKRRPNGRVDLTFGSGTGQLRIDLQTPLKSAILDPGDKDKISVIATPIQGSRIKAQFRLDNDGEVQDLITEKL